MADVVIALLALVVATPAMLVIALLICATSPGPILYMHRRIGFAGKPFDCWKFRTMVVEADALLAETLARNPEAAVEWKQARKLQDDPRITGVGRVLRKLSLDELPQLFNILRGEMSCVGPRPVVPDELEQYAEFRREYLRARPGLTGLWQVSGRSCTTYSSRVFLDCQYVRNWSLMSDFVILLRTSVAVLRLDEAY